MELSKKHKILTDILDDGEPVNKIIFTVDVLRTKKDKRCCGYGPGKKSYGWKCPGCETSNRICLYFHVETETPGNKCGYSFVTSYYNTIKSFARLSELSIIANISKAAEHKTIMNIINKTSLSSYKSVNNIILTAKILRTTEEKQLYCFCGTCDIICIFVNVKLDNTSSFDFVTCDQNTIYILSELTGVLDLKYK